MKSIRCHQKSVGFIVLVIIVPCICLTHGQGSKKGIALTQVENVSIYSHTLLLYLPQYNNSIITRHVTGLESHVTGRTKRLVSWGLISESYGIRK